MRKLALGPAMAMRNSSRGFSGSRLRRVRPPKGWSTISSLPMPSARARSACESSWPKMERKRPKVVARPASQAVAASSRTCCVLMVPCSKLSAMTHAERAKTTNQR
jgi:hypothetical protein